MAGLRQALLAARELGLGPVLRYADYQAGLWTGRHRRQTPVFEWAKRPLPHWLKPGVPSGPAAYFEFRRSHAPKFFFPVEETPRPVTDALRRSEPAVRGAADEILRGEFRLFGGVPKRLGVLPNWGAGRWARTTHWSRVGQKAFDDIRLTWEPGRFSFVFPLARAYRLTGEAKYFEGFWRLFESWCQAWPANAGPHWISGQEVAIRLMGLSFAWYAFGPDLRRSPDRAAILVAAIAAHAARIPPTMVYASAQGNNHLLSEAAGLYTAGVLFPELAGAREWKDLGRGTFLRGLAEQVFGDGGYVQHSTRYHRLALDLATWCARLAQVQGEPFPDDALARLRRSTACLAALVDPVSGQPSNFGHNDGTHLLPLTDLAGGDFRPTLQAASRLFIGSSIFAGGPWDELALWLGLDAAEVGGRQERESFPEAGLYIARGVRSQATLRCARFRTRPSHSDQLHLDLWVDGVNLVRDPGTYRYKSEGDWAQALAGATGHNGPVVDRREPMDRAGRFLWTRWAQGKLHGRWGAPSGAMEAMRADHTGYRRFGIRVLRTVARAGDEAWLIADEVLGRGRHSVSCHWLLPDGRFGLEGNRVVIDREGVRASLEAEGTGIKLGLYREGRLIAGQAAGERAEGLGWFSPTYDALSPGLSVVFTLDGRLPQRLETKIVLAGGQAPRMEPAGGAGRQIPMKGAVVVWKNERLKLG